MIVLGLFALELLESFVDPDVHVEDVWAEWCGQDCVCYDARGEVRRSALFMSPDWPCEDERLRRTQSDSSDATRDARSEASAAALQSRACKL